MKLLDAHLIILLLLLGLSCSSQEQKKRIAIQVPTIEQEATSIWRTINDIAFFKKQGYKINLPNNRLIDSLIVKSTKGNFGNEDFSSIYNLLESGVFNEADYQHAVQKVQAQEQLINDILHRLDSAKDHWDWNFKVFDPYPIVFTLYGTGGSYDPDNGRVTLFTTVEGEFMNYDNPANTIIHEIIHMGIEASIVQKYKLSHGLKERIVDTIVSILFKKQLPEFKIQNMGDIKIDEYLKNKEDLSRLDLTVEKYLDNN